MFVRVLEYVSNFFVRSGKMCIRSAKQRKIIAWEYTKKISLCIVKLFFGISADILNSNFVIKRWYHMAANKPEKIKKKRKRIILPLILLAAFVFVLSGCGGQTGQSPEKDTVSENSAGVAAAVTDAYGQSEAATATAKDEP